MHIGNITLYLIRLIHNIVRIFILKFDRMNSVSIMQ